MCRDIRVVLLSIVMVYVVLTYSVQWPQNVLHFCQVCLLLLRHKGAAAKAGLAGVQVELLWDSLKASGSEVLDSASQFLNSMFFGVPSRGFCVMRGRSLVLSTCILFVLIGRSRVFSIGLGNMVAVKVAIVMAWFPECMVTQGWHIAGIAMTGYSGVQWATQMAVHMICTHVVFIVYRITQSIFNCQGLT